MTIQKTQKITYGNLSLFLRRFSVIIAYYFNQLGVTPNQVVLFRVIIFGGASLFLFFSDNYIYNVLGIGTIFLCYFFDLVDGDLARNHNMKTDLGKFLDEELDAVVINSLIFMFVSKFLFFSYETIYVLGGIFALFGIIGSTKMTGMFQSIFGINCVSGHSEVEQAIQTKKRDKRSEHIYQLVTPKNFFLSLFSNFRYYLLFGILSGYIEVALLLFAIAINIRRISLFISIAWYYHEREHLPSQISFFNIMHLLEKDT